MLISSNNTTLTRTYRKPTRARVDRSRQRCRRTLEALSGTARAPHPQTGTTIRILLQVLQEERIIPYDWVRESEL